jgi:Phage P22-like portal protein
MRGNGAPDVVALSYLGTDNVLEEARERFRACSEWEAAFRRKFIDDVKFAAADTYNGWQWPDEIRKTRDLSDRPCLTLNVVRQHNLQIENESRRNKASARILGMGNGATQESANVVKAIIRHIEYTSKAQRNAYTPARHYQVAGGIGWWRIVTDYESNDSFDQEIFIQGIPDPMSVYMDPDCQRLDCSDSRYAFVFSFLPRDLVLSLVPDYPWDVGAPKMPIGIAPGESFFIEKDHWMVCEYFRKVPRQDKLISFISRGERQTVRASTLPSESREELMRDPLTLTRNVVDQVIEWKLIVGDQIIDETIWPGKYIPLIRCIGEENVVGGLLDRCGHTRSMQDAQRMFNYNASGSVEFGALQSKTPWVAAAASIEGLEQIWNTANTENHAVLPFKHVDDDNPDKDIPPPTRIEPPASSPLFNDGMKSAFEWMMMTSGQYANQQGQMGNERTGTAIQERLQQGETSTYHFQDNYEDALVYTYQQIIDLIPKIYDTRRIKHILADDGTEMEVDIDPRAQQAYVQEMDRQNTVVRRVFNPTMGKYDVAAEVGPNLTSKRKEAVEALTLMLTEAPALTGLIGDILLRNMEFDDAQEAALRLKRMVPPQALGQGPTQAEQQQQMIIQQLQSALQESIQRQGKNELKLVGKDQMRAIDVYEAETDRIKALAPMLPMDQEGVEALITQLVDTALKTNLMPILERNISQVHEQSGNEEEEISPHPAATRAPDGHYYLVDPTRQGRYLRLEPLVEQESATGRGSSRPGGTGGGG